MTTMTTGGAGTENYHRDMMRDIWDSMDRRSRTRLLRAIMRDGYSRTSAFYFCRGERRVQRHYRSRMCRHVNRITGGSWLPEQLFTGD